MTTTPLSLADAVEKILTIKIIKVPAHEIGLMLSGFAFVPTLVDDTDRRS